MKVQRIRHPDGKTDWIVIGDDYLPIEPIRKYLKYCWSLERSPTTIETYARHLKCYRSFAVMIVINHFANHLQTDPIVLNAKKVIGF